MQAESIDYEDIKDYLNVNEDNEDSTTHPPPTTKPNKDPKKLR